VALFRDLAAPSSSVESLLAVSWAEALEEGLEELSLLAEGDSLADCESSAEGEAEGEGEALADAESREATGAFTAGAQAARPSRLARLRDNTAIDFFTETFSFRQAS
jgi:hypothetical protein